MNNDTQIITHTVFTLFVHNLYEIMRMKKKNNKNCYWYFTSIIIYNTFIVV